MKINETPKYSVCQNPSDEILPGLFLYELSHRLEGSLALLLCFLEFQCVVAI